LRHGAILYFEGSLVFAVVCTRSGLAPARLGKRIERHGEHDADADDDLLYVRRGRETSDATTGADGNTIAVGGLLQEIATLPCETHRVFILRGLRASR